MKKKNNNYRQQRKILATQRNEESKNKDKNKTTINVKFKETTEPKCTITHDTHNKKKRKKMVEARKRMKN